MVQVVKPDFTFEDARGRLAQLAHGGLRQVNFVFSKSGSCRGGHFHKENTEVFYVAQGKFEVTLEEGGKTEKYIFQTGDMFYICPMTGHSFYYLEDTYLIVMYDIGVEHPDGSKDIYSF